MPTLTTMTEEFTISAPSIAGIRTALSHMDIDEDGVERVEVTFVHSNGDSEPEPESDGRSSAKPDTPGRAVPDTKEYAVLHALDETIRESKTVDDEFPDRATSAQVHEHCADWFPGDLNTIQSSLSRLENRKLLVDHEVTIGESGNRTYAYAPTDAGRQEIERLGAPTYPEGDDDGET